MLDRSIFKQSITAQISKKNIGTQCLDLQKGDIRTFLEDNFPSLDNEARPKINQEMSQQLRLCDDSCRTLSTEG